MSQSSTPESEKTPKTWKKTVLAFLGGSFVTAAVPFGYTVVMDYLNDKDQQKKDQHAQVIENTRKKQTNETNAKLDSSNVFLKNIIDVIRENNFLIQKQTASVTQSISELETVLNQPTLDKSEASRLIKVISEQTKSINTATNEITQKTNAIPSFKEADLQSIPEVVKVPLLSSKAYKAARFDNQHFIGVETEHHSSISSTHLTVYVSNYGRHYLYPGQPLKFEYESKEYTIVLESIDDSGYTFAVTHKDIPRK